MARLHSFSWLSSVALCILSTSIRVYVCVWLSGGSVVKDSLASAGDAGDMSLIPGLGKSPGGGNDNPLQNSCLEIPMDSTAWWASVYEAAKSQAKGLSTF